MCLLSEKNEECDRSCNSTLHSTPRPLTRDRRQAITRTSYSREIYHILSPEIFIFKKTGDNSGDREIDIPNGTFHLELLWSLLFIFNIKCHHDVWIIHWAPFIYLFLDLDSFTIPLTTRDFESSATTDRRSTGTTQLLTTQPTTDKATKVSTTQTGTLTTASTTQRQTAQVLTAISTKPKTTQIITATMTQLPFVATEQNKTKDDSPNSCTKLFDVFQFIFFQVIALILVCASLNC